MIGKDAYLLREESTVTLDYESTDAHKERVANLIKMMSGKMLSVFGQGKKRMITSTAVIGIRGTAAYVEAEPERTYICTCYGRTEIEAKASPEVLESIKTKHHESARYVFAQTDGSLIVMAPVINHTDKKLIMLEGRVWRKPPFYDEGGGRGGGY